MGENTSVISVLCVDDHRLLLAGLELIITAQPDLTVAGVATSGEDAVRMYKSCHPDVTLMDLQLPGMSGVDAIRAIRREDPSARIVVVTMYDGDEDVFRALDAGAATYLLKETLSDELIQVIRRVHAGERPITPRVVERLEERSEYEALTPREVDVLELVSYGLANKEIAEKLNLSEWTVRVHVKNILAKLQVTHRTGAVNVALQRGIIHVK